MNRQRYWLYASVFLTVWSLLVLAYGSFLGGGSP